MSKSEKIATKYTENTEKQGKRAGIIIAAIITFLVLSFGSRHETVTCAGSLQLLREASSVNREAKYGIRYAIHEIRGTNNESPQPGEVPCVFSSAQGTDISATKENDWLDKLIDKIWLVESSRQLNPLAGDGGQAVGPLQLHECVLIDVNRHYGTNFEPDDRQSLDKSKQIAKLYIAMWFEIYKEEIAARIYNGGPRGWRKSSTDQYYERIFDTD